MISEADRLLAPGTYVTIAGKSRRFRFGFKALRYLEREYGGLDVFYAKLTEPGFGATRLDTIFKGLVAGLLHGKPPEQDQEDFEAELEEMLEPKQLITYLEAVVEAFVQSIPAMETAASPKANGSRGHSRGRASTTSRRSATAATTRSSGT